MEWLIDISYNIDFSSIFILEKCRSTLPLEYYSSLMGAQGRDDRSFIKNIILVEFDIK
jgi:hypothetical protein